MALYQANLIVGVRGDANKMWVFMDETNMDLVMLIYKPRLDSIVPYINDQFHIMGIKAVNSTARAGYAAWVEELNEAYEPPEIGVFAFGNNCLERVEDKEKSIHKVVKLFSRAQSDVCKRNAMLPVDHCAYFFFLANIFTQNVLCCNQSGWGSVKQIRKKLNEALPPLLKDLGIHTFSTNMISPYSFGKGPSGMYDLDGALTHTAVFAWWGAANEAVWAAHHPNKSHDRKELLEFLRSYRDFRDSSVDP